MERARVILHLTRRTFSSRCPFETLGVPREASEQEVKEAYRALARRWHPDTCTDGDKPKAERRFREASAAYAEVQEARQQGRVAGPGEPERTTSESGATWRRRYARPKRKDAGAQHDERYWQDRARASRPSDYGTESEFYQHPPGQPSWGRLVLGPIIFAVGFAFVLLYSSTSGEPESKATPGTSSSALTTEAVYNHKRKRWETPTPAMYRDPALATLIQQMPVKTVHRPAGGPHGR